ncbi:MAG TPA: SDR family oxidoreductase, partial [Syntrophales bacterium]|nr:SDR family oxidoreductase [Syntrophales bacterium]
NELSRSVDAIYHSAAFVNHMLNYDSMKVHNVHGTLSMIEFAGNIQAKPIHFISSSAVCFQMNGDSLLSVHQFETPIDGGNALVNGYAQTKWVSEHHLLQAQAKGIAITIFRCGEITGSSQTGYGIAEDLFHNYLKIFSNAGVVPQWDGGVIDIVPVDYVCGAIVAVSRQSDCYGKIYHLTHPNPIPVRDFFEYLAKVNPSWSKVSFEEWADRCLQYITTLPDSSARIILSPYFAKNGADRRMFEHYFQDPGLKNDHLQRALQNTDITFPKINEVWWEKFMRQI